MRNKLTEKTTHVCRCKISTHTFSFSQWSLQVWWSYSKSQNCVCVAKVKQSWRRLAICWRRTLPRADPVCSQGCSGWWTELCSTDSSQIADFSIVIYLKSVTWAHRVAVPEWLAAVLLMSYFAVFTLSNCPRFTSVVGVLCSALTYRASVNERLRLTSRKCSLAEEEETLHSDSMCYLIKMDSKAFFKLYCPIARLLSMHAVSEYPPHTYTEHYMFDWFYAAPQSLLFDHL